LLKQFTVGTGNKIIVIHPGTGGTNKNWGLENFCQLAKQLRERNFEALFLLGPAELHRLNDSEIRRLRNIGPCVSGLSLTDIVAFLSGIDAFIGNDSGVTHIAAGLGIKTLAIFGPTDPAIYKPVGPRVEVFKRGPADFGRFYQLLKRFLETVLWV